MSDKLSSRIMSLFVNRKDVYAEQFLQGKKKGFRKVAEEITPKLINQHLQQKAFLGVYNLNQESLVKWGCADFDLNTLEDFEKAKQLTQKMKEKGFNPLMELSGGGDFKVHVWAFSRNLIPSKQMKDFLLWCCKVAKVEPHEIFPKQDKIPKEGFGNLVKLPLGLHLVTKKKSCFLGEDFKPLVEEDKIMQKVEYHFDNKDTIPIVESLLVKEEESDPKTQEDKKESPSDWDVFFNYVLDNKLSKGSETTTEKIGKNEVGVNNNVLKNMGIWFYQKKYTLEKLEAEIKPRMFKAGRSSASFNNLKGWFKKAQRKEIKEISKGEIIEWCKLCQPSLLNLIEFGTYLKIKDIQFKTSHLPHFDLIDDLIHLKGDIYKGIKKQAYDQIISLAVPDELMNVRIGDIETDLRMHIASFMPSGKGKMEVKEGIKAPLLLFNPEANIKEPRAIHKEQLIGKTIKRKIKDSKGKPKEVYLKKFGFMSADLLILEEANEIFNSLEKNDVDCRDILTVGMDTYGKNLIQKQNIDNLDTNEETISYHPKVRVLAFSQPHPLKEHFAIKGLQRRFSIDYKKFPERTNTDFFASRLNKQSRNEKSAMEMSIFMRQINNLSGKLIMDKEAFEPFILYHQALLEQGFQQGGKAKNFTRIVEYPMQNTLLKTAGLRALSNLRTNITKEDIENAFVDLVERFTFELYFIERLVKGSLDYGESWGGATGKNQECLEWLFKKGATSKKDSEVYISSFQRQIARIYDKSERRARDTYTELKEEGYISDWLGQGRENKVWCKIKPTIEKKAKTPGINPKTLYYQLINPGRTIECPTSNPCKKEEITSGRTAKSGRTPKTQKTQLSYSKGLPSISEEKDKPLAVLPVRGVQAVQPEKEVKSGEINFEDSGI